MTSGARKYLSEQHKADFVSGVKIAADYGETMQSRCHNEDDTFLDLVWSIPFFLWGGSCDEMSENNALIEQFVNKLVQQRRERNQ